MAKVLQTLAVLICLGVAADMAYTEIRPYTEITAIHTMAAGETLWDVANGYMAKQDKYKDVRYLVDDIRKASGLTDKEFVNQLQAGTEIIVPLKVAK